MASPLLEPSFGVGTSHTAVPESASMYVFLDSKIELLAELKNTTAAREEVELCPREQEGSIDGTSPQFLVAFSHDGILQRMASLSFLDGAFDEESLEEDDTQMEGSVKEKTWDPEETEEPEDESQYSDDTWLEEAVEEKTWEPEETEESEDESQDSYDTLLEGAVEENTWEPEITEELEDKSKDMEGKWLEEPQKEGTWELEGTETETESEEERMNENFSVTLRIWSTRANLVFYDSTGWIFTKAYSLQWLSIKAMESLVREMKESRHILNFDASTIHNQQSIGRCQFEGLVVITGKGATCNVWLCSYFYDKNHYALKMIRLDNDVQIQTEPREVTILSSLRNEYIVKFSQAWVESNIDVEYKEASEDGSIVSGDESTESERCTYLLIQMEYCPGSLQDYLSPPHEFDAPKSFQYFKEITEGLKYIHKQGVIHRDMKPGNVFLGLDGVAKVGDFGRSCFRPNDCPTFTATPNLGTLGYEAPELEAGKNISEKVDIFPLGIMYFSLFISYATLVQRHNEYIQFKNDTSRKNWECLSWQGNSSFCMELTAEDPLKRPCAADILESLHKRTRLSQKCEKSTKNDVKMIENEGCETQSEEELRQTCHHRGHLGLRSTEEIWKQSVSKERQEFLSLVPNEIELYNSMIEKDTTKEANRAYMAAREESDDAVKVALKEDVPLALIEKVDAMFQKYEKDIDGVDAQTGNHLQLLDRDHDGKVTPKEAAAAKGCIEKGGIQELISELSKDKEGTISL
ncbi:calcium-dependent protein kinase 4 isoform X3 [Triticum aestivum]|uniref:calcium-dependent protein kinase 4 isoform X3 n=1 Tax=Triticum aestivum TaxID=4565 RepID=UPI001D02E9B1|nr:calcium-dependent protein kinase 4-like isoform X3 [Triticum aestivum]